MIGWAETMGVLVLIGLGLKLLTGGPYPWREWRARLGGEARTVERELEERWPK